MDFANLTQEKVDLIKQLTPEQIETLLKGSIEKERNIAEVREFLNRFYTHLSKNSYYDESYITHDIDIGGNVHKSLSNILSKYPDIKVIIVVGHRYKNIKTNYDELNIVSYEQRHDTHQFVIKIEIYEDFVSDEMNKKFDEIFDKKQHKNYPNLYTYDGPKYLHWCSVYEKIKDHLQTTL